MKDKDMSFENIEYVQFSEDVLSLPIKKTRQLQKIHQLKVEEKKIMKQLSSKAMTMQQSKRMLQQPLKASISESKKDNFAKIPNTISNTQYTMNCIMNALNYRKLKYDQISSIFQINDEIVEQIQNFKNGNKRYSVQSKRLAEKNKILRRLELIVNGKGDGQSNIKGSIMRKSTRYERNEDKEDDEQKRISRSISEDFKSILNKQISLENKGEQTSEDNENLLEHQELIKYKPPHQLSKKYRAIVKVLKQKPNIMQKDILTILSNEYDIKDMTQTSISRYLKRLYQIDKKCKIIVQAVKDGFLDIDLSEILNKQKHNEGFKERGGNGPASKKK